MLSLETSLSSLDLLLSYSQHFLPNIVFKDNSLPASIKNTDQHHSKYGCANFHAFYTKCIIFVFAAPLFS